MRVAIIPARGGSKRIIGKNTKRFCGKPIIAYAIETALQSELFDRVIVSTDSEDVASIARQFGAEAPFLRPSNLADDYTPIVHVVRNAVQWLEQHVAPVDLACCIYSTAPFLRVDDLRRGLKAFLDSSDADFAVAVTSFDFPIYRALHVQDGYLQLIWPEHELTRSQDLPEAVHDAAMFYWGRPLSYASNNWIISKTVPVYIPRWLVQDIDTEEDWVRAELMKKALDSSIPV
jgi:pseudaminic acid cytidylyltransferase